MPAADRRLGHPTFVLKDPLSALLIALNWSLHSVASHWLRNGVDGSQCELRAFLNEHARRQIADQSHKRDARQEREA